MNKCQINKGKIQKNTVACAGFEAVWMCVEMLTTAKTK